MKPIILRNGYMLIQRWLPDPTCRSTRAKTLHLHFLDSWEELVNQEAIYNLPVPIGSIRTPACDTADLLCCWWSLFLQLCPLTPQGQYAPCAPPFRIFLLETTAFQLPVPAT